MKIHRIMSEMYLCKKTNNDRSICILNLAKMEFPTSMEYSEC